MDSASQLEQCGLQRSLFLIIHFVVHSQYDWPTLLMNAPVEHFVETVKEEFFEKALLYDDLGNPMVMASA